MKDFNEFKAVMESYVQMKNKTLNENNIPDRVLNDIIVQANELELNDPKSGRPYKTGENSKGMVAISKVGKYVVGSIGELISSKDLDIKKLQSKNISVSDTDKIIDGARELELNDPKSGRPYNTGESSRNIDNLYDYENELKYVASAVAELIGNNSVKLNDLLG